MSKGRRLSEHEKGLIDALSREDKSILYISSKICRSRGVITSYLKQGQKYGTIVSTGRPQVVSPRKRLAIIKRSQRENDNCQRNQGRIGDSGLEKHCIKNIKKRF